MGFKDIGKKIGDAALKLATSGCECSGGCGGCGICKGPPSPTTREDEKTVLFNVVNELEEANVPGDI